MGTVDRSEGPEGDGEKVKKILPAYKAAGAGGECWTDRLMGTVIPVILARRPCLELFGL